MVKYLKHDGAGAFQEEATVTTGGAPSANKIPELDSNGRLTSNMMPTGIGADTASIQASEALSAGDFVNVHNVTGSARIRKADGTASGKEAHGFVLAAVASGATGTVYFEGLNDQVTGQTPGVAYLSGATAGLAVTTAPTGAGKVVQRLGVAISATAINVELEQPVLLA